MKTLPTLQTAFQYQSLTEKPPLPLDLCIVYLDMWYSGEAMYSAGSRQRDYSEITASFNPSEYVNFIRFARWLQNTYPISGRYLYRSINTTYDFLKPAARIVSKNPLSSWTSSEDKAKRFFETVGSLSIQDNETACIIKCLVPESRILFSTDTVKQFIEEYYDLHDFSGHENSKAIKFYNNLNKDFWKNQDEYVCRTKEFPLPVTIVASALPYSSGRFGWYAGIGAFIS